ncbi:MAG: thiamine diphosphokinase [Bacteroides sp.]|nr:thiamine diphosphokinase [Roseburia sp.]MCM1461270.1 thiamine diphosphokinase [Bacteroides sp.]
MKTCYIFGAGEFFGLVEPIAADKAPLVIAADGGLRYVDALGLRADAVVGDFDSLGRVPEGGNVTVLPIEKDTTDLYEAVRLGEERGCTEFHLYGGTGGRLDHTLANLSLLGGMAERGLRGTLYGDRYAVATAYPGGALVLHKKKDTAVSVFSLSDRAEGVTLKGLYYPLEDGSLTNLFPLGVSNRMTAETAEITVKKGILLIYYTL